ncbi:MAG: chemotaxis protein CheD [Thermoplasmatota archaeon]
MTDEFIVDMATLRVADNPARLTCLGLGSCLGIALYDHRVRIGGLAHAMLPLFELGRNKRNPARYVDTSIYIMLDEIVEKGGRKHNIQAKIIGGARMFSIMGSETMDIGQRNIEAARETLKNERIPIKAMDVGGNKGRTMIFDLKTGVVEIKNIRGKNKEI